MRFAPIQRDVTIAEGEQDVLIRAIRSDPPTDRTAVRVRIHAVDAATASPIAGVDVILDGLDGDAAYQLGILRTDAHGEVERTVAPFTRYRVRTFGPMSTRPPMIVTRSHWTGEFAPTGGLLDVRCEIPRRAPGSAE
jgi:hypothetical protein